MRIQNVRLPLGRGSLTYAKNRAKWSAAEDFCEDRQMKFLILTEEHLGV